ncbi:MFS transporter [Rhizobium sp. Root483D2]|uniref:MFS transporter n=1 Tax=Rhizobium sp. Root483D2 TaxID=1736545 RepID=UPI00071359C7|nr:MFS transporter [Rhizobium sp. Root483D2]KQY19356.1 MFS transporter [Rhizobium sp. Root483D2]
MSTVTEDSANGNRIAPENPLAAPTQPIQPPPEPMSPARAAIYMASSLLLFLTQGLGMNLLNANIYQLQGSLSATTSEIAWLSAAYIAPYASMSIALFKIRMQYGLRRFAELSIVCFVLASVLNIFVSDLHSATVVRFLSGMAAAPLSTLGFLYMLEAFPAARKLSVGLSLALMNTTLSAPIARIISPPLMDLGGWHALYTFEMGLALMALPVVYLLPLTPPPRANVIQKMDILSYLLLAIGFGCLAVFLTLGRLYWWFEVPWLGVLLAGSIAALTLMVALELPRKMPLIDLRWVFSRENMHMAGILLLFRVVSSEQTTTAANFYMQLGLINDQTQTMYTIILLASIAGGLVCTVLMLTRYVETAHVLALVLIACGAFLDSQSTSLTRPEQMYLSQAMVAAGAAMFLPPVMSKGFATALAKGAPFLVNFLVIFLFTQSIGALVAQAALGTFVTLREKFHSNVLVEHILLTNPFVAQRVSQLSGSYGKVITDKSLLNAEGLQLLGQQVTREANVLAYNDAFLVISVASAIGLVLLLGHLTWRRFVPHTAAAPAVATPS